MQRDGMDSQLALDIAGTMDAETINALIEEANTAVIEKTNTAQAGSPLEPASEPEPEKKVAVSFVEIPALVSDEKFAEEVLDCARSALSKNSSELNYKATKKVLFAKLKAAVGINKLVECLGIKVEPYIGKSVSLDEHKLLEAGVDPDLIKKGWKTVEYEDVRFTLPAEMKPKKEPK